MEVDLFVTSVSCNDTVRMAVDRGWLSNSVANSQVTITRHLGTYSLCKGFSDSTRRRNPHWSDHVDIWWNGDMEDGGWNR